MAKINNPVLAGFNPDPCLFKGKESYYILVSTFEFVPGIRVYESKDMVNWNYKTSILTDTDLRGNGRGCSIWAPFAAYHNGKYYVIYTDVKSTRVPFKDVNNYIITSDSIMGPWSKPKYINSSGFDPSIFFDDDNKAYFLNEYWDYRLETHNKSAGIVIQQLDPTSLDLLDQSKILFNGTSARKTEAPEIYKHNGYYYLLTAEGGTEAGHMVTVARSKNINGPYEVDPKNPMLTAKDDASLLLQCSGHASIVAGPNSEWYMAHLMTRPLQGEFPLLGRETSIQNIEWTSDDWLRLKNGTNQPSDYYEVSSDTQVTSMPHEFHDDFTSDSLDYQHWNTLRVMPNSSWLKMGQQTHLQITGGESPQSTFDQHLIGKRQTDFKFQATTELSFSPISYMQLAGMALYLDIDNYLFLAITYDEKVGKCVRLLQSVKGEFNIINDPIAVKNHTFTLKIDVDELLGKFEIVDGKTTTTVKDNVALGFLSGGFTGNFIALDVIDMAQKNRAKAQFNSFDYLPK
ncbi:glycosyl hydrolase family 43 [Paucilactobacillus hokkaidonensis JCM 18461]|uniref:Glycosyl hydrolase family 43 n=2 Tax=Paucilactobacillus hokkaidonensis TaxID=1193095 RepID=A0A0A1GR36_9LACO|nr:glycoside hydrolase family 43 protein [Paucilactobacillus hokkaidonensis]KRO09864.1 glycosyl hydrolase family 43 [Paucilactobacillus hokkaidonensis]BAP84752.1 glycosyl hydrolase family 43 [Paucilactobacillus hokkaidonensis JCM 18461]